MHVFCIVFCTALPDSRAFLGVQTARHLAKDSAPGLWILIRFAVYSSPGLRISIVLRFVCSALGLRIPTCFVIFCAWLPCSIQFAMYSAGPADSNVFCIVFCTGPQDSETLRNVFCAGPPDSQAFCGVFCTEPPDSYVFHRLFCTAPPGCHTLRKIFCIPAGGPLVSRRILHLASIFNAFRQVLFTWLPFPQVCRTSTHVS